MNLYYTCYLEFNNLFYLEFFTRWSQMWYFQRNWVTYRDHLPLDIFLVVGICGPAQLSGHGHELNWHLFRKSWRRHGHGHGVKPVSTALCSTQRKKSFGGKFICDLICSKVNSQQIENAISRNQYQGKGSK